MRKYLVMVMVAVLACGVYAQPSIEEGTRELSIAGAWDPEGPTGTALQLTAGYGLFLRDALEVGASLGYESYEDAGGSGVDLKAWQLGGFVEHHFDMATMTVPYIGARVGYLKAELGSWDESAFVYGPRVGIKHFIADNVAVDIGLEFMFATEDMYCNDGTYEDSDITLEFGIRAMF